MPIGLLSCSPLLVFCASKCLLEYTSIVPKFTHRHLMCAWLACPSNKHLSHTDAHNLLLLLALL